MRMACLLLCLPAFLPAQGPSWQDLVTRQQAWAFAHASMVLRVRVERVEDARVQVTVREAIHGLAGPQQLWLRELGEVKHGQGWLVAILAEELAVNRGDGSLSCLARLPDTADNLQKVRGWALPIYRHAPIVFFADRLHRQGQQLQFRGVEPLRSRLAGSGLVLHLSQQGMILPELGRGERFLVAAYSHASTSKSGRRILALRSLRRVTKDEAAAIRQRFIHELEGSGYLDPALGFSALTQLSRAWRYQAAELVALTRLRPGPVIAPGAGLYRVGYQITELLRPRGKIDAGSPRFGTGLGAIGGTQLLLPPATLQITGGVPGQSPMVSERLTKERLRRVRGYLATRPPRFSHFESTSQRVLPAMTDAFDEPISPLHLCRRRDPVLGAWIRLEVLGTGHATVEGRPAGTLRLRCLDTHPKIPSLTGQHFCFVGAVVPNWPTGRRLWGYALSNRVPLDPRKPSRVQDWVFLPSSFVASHGQGTWLRLILRQCSGEFAGGPRPEIFGKGLQSHRGIAALALARRLLADNFRSKDPDHPKRVEAAIQELALAVPRAVALDQHELESRGLGGLDAKLLAIAWHLHNNPGSHRELRHRYLESVHSRRSRGPRSPLLLAEHCGAGQRLIWEWFLLNPRRHSSEQWEIRCSRALAKIADPASIPLLEEVYRLTCVPGVDLNWIGWAQLRVIETLASMPSARALRALLACQAWTREHQERIPKEARHWDALPHLRKVLADAPGYGWLNGSAWRKVIDAYPQAGLNPSQRQLLKEVLSQLRAAAK